MKRIKFINLENHDFSKYEYVVYAHSFTDGQLVYGNDEFENTYDWLDFTLKNLSRLNKKVLIKAHRTFMKIIWNFVTGIKRYLKILLINTNLIKNLVL